MINLKTNKDDKVIFENKDDVIRWVKRMLSMHPLSVDKCAKANFSGKKVEVFTDEVIRQRYREMIEWLENPNEVA